MTIAALVFDPGLGGYDSVTITVTYNPCSPKVSMPPQLFTINPMWTDCSKGIDGFFDPPYTLTKGNGLSAHSAMDAITPAPQSQTTSAAAAGSTPVLITPVITTTDSAQVAPVSNPSPNPQDRHHLMMLPHNFQPRPTTLLCN
jgi:hypothetical protein